MLDFSFLTEAASLGGGSSNLHLLFLGWQNTLVAFLASILIALSLGIPLGVIRSLPNARVASVVATYVHVFRNIPLLVQLFLWFFVLPEVVPVELGDWLKIGLPNPEYWNLVVALGIYMSARIVELTRSGIGSLSSGQFEASRALGLSTYKAYRHVILPQALRVIMPPLTTEFTNCLKATSVGLTVGYIELTQRSREIAEQTFRTFEVFSMATLGYLVTVMLLTFVLFGIEQYFRIPGLKYQG